MFQGEPGDHLHNPMTDGKEPAPAAGATGARPGGGPGAAHRAASTPQRAMKPQIPKLTSLWDRKIAANSRMVALGQ